MVNNQKLRLSGEFRGQIKNLRKRRMQEIRLLPTRKQRKAIRKLELDIARLEFAEEKRVREEQRIRERARFKARGGIRGEISKLGGAPQARRAVSKKITGEFREFKKGGGLVGAGFRAVKKAGERQRQRRQEPKKKRRPLIEIKPRRII